MCLLSSATMGRGTGMRPIAGSEDCFPNWRKSAAPPKAACVVGHLFEYNNAGSHSVTDSCLRCTGLFPMVGHGFPDRLHQAMSPCRRGGQKRSPKRQTHDPDRYHQKMRKRLHGLIIPRKPSAKPALTGSSHHLAKHLMPPGHNGISFWI